MEFAHQTLDEFLRLLRSPDPVPAGGSATAIGAAQGAALVAKLARVALRRDEREEVAGTLEHLAAEGDRLSERLAALAAADAQAYNEVMRAYRLPRASEPEKQARTEAIHQALARATEVPLAIMEAAAAAMDALVTLVPHLPAATRADAGAAGWLLRATVEGAALLVRANWHQAGMQPALHDGWGRLEALLARSRRLFDELRSSLSPLTNGGVPSGLA